MPDNSNTSPSTDDKVSLKEIRETFYRCRDFEIKNLWQRSIFLFGFILACFTGYGAILMALLTSGEQNVDNPIWANAIECIISLVGIVFSLIWIMMSKGSKAWYEIYEKAIGRIEDKANNDIEHKNSVIIKSNEYKLGNYCEQYSDYIDDSIFSTKGGRFSPSKINIFIGQTLFVIWCICLLIHSSILFNKFLDDMFVQDLPFYIFFAFFYIGLLALLFLLYQILINQVASGTIKEI